MIVMQVFGTILGVALRVVLQIAIIALTTICILAFAVAGHKGKNKGH